MPVAYILCQKKFRFFFSSFFCVHLKAEVNHLLHCAECFSYREELLLRTKNYYVGMINCCVIGK